MVIDSRTRIGLLTVAAAIPTLTTLVVWAVRVEAKADHATKTNERQERQIDEQSKMFIEIRDRLIRIETNQQRGKHGN